MLPKITLVFLCLSCSLLQSQSLVSIFEEATDTIALEIKNVENFGKYFLFS